MFLTLEQILDRVDYPKYGITVGGNKEGIAKYIREQEHEDQIYDQLTLKEYADPFKD